MDCPPKKVAFVERWPLWKGGRWYKFDRNFMMADSLLQGVSL